MKHLLSIDDLSELQIRALVDKALHHPPKAQFPDPKKFPVALIFMEPSTRTRVSFTRAAEVLGKQTVYLGVGDTSFTKNESLEDTLLNLAALGYGAFIVRVPEEVSLEDLRSFKGGPIINGGNGSIEHPTQALLDLATILKNVADADWKKLLKLKITISGDLKHSRVVGSWSRLAQKLGLNIVWSSPEAWRNLDAESRVGTWAPTQQEALEGVDVWMALRVQKERFSSDEASAAGAEALENFQMSSKLLGSRYLMHPGPVNWGIELSSDLKEHPKSLILGQVEMGLAFRAVLIDYLIHGIKSEGSLGSK